MKKQKTELVGMKEIARRANVSIGTVDRVVHGRDGVSAKTRAKIDEIIKELNYQPNLLASRLASKKIYRLAILIPKVSVETDFWSAPLNGIKRAEVAVSGYGVTVAYHLFDLNDRRSFETQSKLILKNAPDGVLVAPSFINEAAAFTRQCNEAGIPYVLIDSNIPNQEGLCYVGPHLFRSGYLGAHLMNFNLAGKGKILVLNIAKELDDHHYLTQIEEGFRAYHRYHSLYNQIVKLDVTATGYSAVEKKLNEVFKTETDIRAIFVTNSRVFTVAQYLERSGLKDTVLIGYDFIEKNIEYLKKDVIDILICHRPGEQGYQGLMKLYQHLVLGKTFDNISFMPIDIITKENYEFYDNYERV
ncbi:MAG: LacI family DNA-binding transcriptional regulator [Agriterribacter sp.]